MQLEEPSGLSRTITFQAGASSSPHGYTPGETATSTVITAQIPAVPAGPSYGVLLPDGTIWYPGSRKRLPAPLPLRIAVWTLAFLVLLAGAGVFVIDTHPAWVDPLRRMVPAAAGSLTVGSPGHPSTSRGTSGSHLAVGKLAPQPSGLPPFTTVYRVRGTTAYQIKVAATATTWVQAFSLSNGADTGSPLFAGDVQPGQDQTIPVSGPVDLEVAAAGATVTVMSGGKQIGTLASAPSAPWHFWLEPASPKL